MSSSQIEIQAIAVLAAAACALPGVFLVLRGMALMCDAISHVVLLGIVIMFFITKDLESPLLTVGAAAMGLVTVVLVEALSQSGRVKRDAAIGLVFPVLFSLGIIMVSYGAGNVHLDTDSVLLGELAFAPFDRLKLYGVDIGPKGIWTMGAILILNAALIFAFFKELKLATFDAGLAASLGFAPAVVHYGLMAVVSVTAVQAFDAVGSILVVALMIAPAAAAWILTDKLSHMLWVAAGLGALGALSGYWLSHWMDASIAGCMAVMLGVIFAIVLMAAPRRGLAFLALRRRRQKISFAGSMLAIHLLHHEDLPTAEQENRVAHLGEHLRWSDHFAMTVVRQAQRDSLVDLSDDGRLYLTNLGRTHAREAVLR
jgi:manganese/zinc/iron transport system permease protein